MEDENEVDEAGDAKASYDRVKERMDMRHQNTSRWAKMALQHAHADKSLRSVEVNPIKKYIYINCLCT